MNMKASLFLVLVVMACVANAQSTWQLCDNAPTGLTVSSVTLNPDPPVRGQDDVVTLTGNVNETVTGGNIALSISYFGIGVFSGNYQVCTAANPCPAGPITASITVSGSSLPAISPPGTYVGTAIITDQNDYELTCVTVTFTLGF